MSEISSELRERVSAALPAFLLAQRWFGGKARRIDGVEIIDLIRADHVNAVVVIVAVQYQGGGEDTYSIPLALTEPHREGDADGETRSFLGGGVNGSVVLKDAFSRQEFLAELLELIRSGGELPGERGRLCGRRTSLFGELASVEKIQAPRLLSGEQSNSSVIYGDRMILKFFRRIEEGENPDLEIGTFLTEKTGFRHIARIAGSLEYEMPQGQRTTQAIMQEFVANRGDAWRYTQEILRAFYERVGERLLEQGGANVAEPPEFSEEAMARLLSEMALLGQRTAELHLALSSETDDGAFAAEPFTAKFQSELLSSVEQLTHRTMGLLRLRMSEIPAEYKREAADLAERENEVGERFRFALTAPIDAMRIRIHGDYHLGQVLYTGSDFVIIDFEGEPARPLAERRLKQSPLQDVGGMLRSFHYAAFAPILTPATGHVIPRERVANLSNWAEEWSRRAGDCFLDRYYETSGEAAYLPSGARERARLLEMYLLAKAIYELGYELNNRPTWVGIPLEGIVRLLAARE